MLRLNALKALLFSSMLLLLGGLACATDVAYTGTFVGTEGLAAKSGQATAATYTRDMNTTGDRVSFQIVYSTYTGASSKTFTDGSASTATITVSSNPAGGITGSYVTINGTRVNFNYDTAFASMTATNICSSMTVVSSIVNCAATGSVVYTTSTAVGTAANYTLTSSTSSAIVPSAATYTGGTNAAYTISTPTITITSNGFVTGLQVLYSTGSGTAISGLSNQTTYYVSIINPNQAGLSSTFKLSSTSTGAVAGLGIVLASSQTKTTADSFTLAPLNFTNTSGGGMQLQWSDDNANWTNATTGNYGATISSVTFSAGGGTALYDLGFIQHRYLRINETPPTTGAATYTATDNERYSFKH